MEVITLLKWFFSFTLTSDRLDTLEMDSLHWNYSFLLDFSLFFFFQFWDIHCFSQEIWEHFMFSIKQDSKSQWFETWSHFRSIFNGGEGTLLQAALCRCWDWWSHASETLQAVGKRWLINALILKDFWLEVTYQFQDHCIDQNKSYGQK